ncbi:DUF1295 domain-containing protein [Patescibacteria group bacterium]
MPISYILLISLVLSLLVYVFFYYISVIQKNNNWADYAWAVGFAVIAMASYLLGGRHDLSKQFLVTTLVLMWSARLLIHIITRNRSAGEIYRYKSLRIKWGSKAVLYSFIRIYLLSWLLMNLVAFPIVAINSSGGYALTKIELIGIIVWAVGFVYETVADYQLYHFKQADGNKKKVFTGGLWKYSRHPNYLGEILMWIGLYLAALPYTYGSLAIISPVIITLMLLGITGIPAIEKRFRENSSYQKYRKKTSILIPWYPRG